MSFSLKGHAEHNTQKDSKERQRTRTEQRSCVNNTSKQQMNIKEDISKKRERRELVFQKSTEWLYD